MTAHGMSTHTEPCGCVFRITDTPDLGQGWVRVAPCRAHAAEVCISWVGAPGVTHTCQYRPGHTDTRSAHRVGAPLPRLHRRWCLCETDAVKYRVFVCGPSDCPNDPEFEHDNYYGCVPKDFKPVTGRSKSHRQAQDAQGLYRWDGGCDRRLTDKPPLSAGTRCLSTRNW